jgi:hypothetical protein
MCSKEFGSEGALTMHLRSPIHNKPPAGTCRCPFCDESFALWSAVAMHLENQLCTRSRMTHHEIAAMVRRWDVKKFWHNTFTRALITDGRANPSDEFSSYGDDQLHKLAFYNGVYNCVVASCPRTFSMLIHLKQHLPKHDMVSLLSVVKSIHLFGGWGCSPDVRSFSFGIYFAFFFFLLWLFHCLCFG